MIDDAQAQLAALQAQLSGVENADEILELERQIEALQAIEQKAKRPPPMVIGAPVRIGGTAKL